MYLIIALSSNWDGEGLLGMLGLPLSEYSKCNLDAIYGGSWGWVTPPLPKVEVCSCPKIWFAMLLCFNVYNKYWLYFSCSHS